MEEDYYDFEWDVDDYEIEQAIAECLPQITATLNKFIKDEMTKATKTLWEDFKYEELRFSLGLSQDSQDIVVLMYAGLKDKFYGVTSLWELLDDFEQTYTLDELRDPDNDAPPDFYNRLAERFEERAKRFREIANPPPVV